MTDKRVPSSFPILVSLKVTRRCNVFGVAGWAEIEGRVIEQIQMIL